MGSRRYPDSDFATSYRAELEGGYNNLLLINEAQAPSNLAQYIDNDQTVKSLTTEYYTPQQMLAPEADIILAYHHLQNNSSITANIEWQRAHLSDGRRIEDLLPRPAE